MLWWGSIGRVHLFQELDQWTFNTVQRLWKILELAKLGWHEPSWVNFHFLRCVSLHSRLWRFLWGCKCVDAVKDDILESSRLGNVKVEICVVHMYHSSFIARCVFCKVRADREEPVPVKLGVHCVFGFIRVAAEGPDDKVDVVCFGVTTLKAVNLAEWCKFWIWFNIIIALEEEVVSLREPDGGIHLFIYLREKVNLGDCLLQEHEFVVLRVSNYLVDIVLSRLKILSLCFDNVRHFFESVFFLLASSFQRVAGEASSTLCADLKVLHFQLVFGVTHLTSYGFA